MSVRVHRTLDSIVLEGLPENATVGEPFELEVRVLDIEGVDVTCQADVRASIDTADLSILAWQWDRDGVMEITILEEGAWVVGIEADLMGSRVEREFRVDAVEAVPPPSRTDEREERHAMALVRPMVALTASAVWLLSLFWAFQFLKGMEEEARRTRDRRPRPPMPHHGHRYPPNHWRRQD